MPTLSVNPDVLLSPVADGYVAYHTTANRLHELNATAALLVELCDGKRTATEIVELAAPVLPPDSDSAVLAWIEHAIASDVLVEDAQVGVDDSGAPAGTARELLPDQLTELSSRLRNEGKVQAAYLCQERVTQLEPNDSDHWRTLGELAHIIGKRAAAKDAYERYLTQCPDDAEIQHLLTSLRDDDAPARVPDECIKQLYERFSDFYDANMVDELGYSGPEHLASAIEDVIGDRQALSMLDLGCGTGLAGSKLKHRVSRMLGVDLSAEMIAIARERKVYDQLEVAEITGFLSDCDQTFDLIVACDTLIYFGDLSLVISSAVEILNPDGVIAFSVEAAAKPPWALTDSGRYVHHLDHVMDVAKNLGLTVTHREEFLRMEYGEEVMALFVTMTRKPA